MASVYLTIEIGNSTLKVANLEIGPNKYTLSNSGVFLIPPACIQPGGVVDIPIFGDFVRECIKRSGAVIVRPVVFLGSGMIVARNFTAPNMTDKEIEEMVRIETESSLPEGGQEHIVRCRKITEKTANKETITRVFLFATRRSAIGALKEALSHAGITPLRITPSDDGQLGMIHNLLCKTEKNEEDIAYALVDYGVKSFEITLARNDIPVVSQKASSLLYKAQEEALAADTMGNAIFRVNMMYNSLPNAARFESTEMLSLAVREILRALTIHANKAQVPISCIYLTGSISFGTQLAEMLTKESGIVCVHLSQLQALESSVFTVERNAPRERVISYFSKIFGAFSWGVGGMLELNESIKIKKEKSRRALGQVWTAMIALLMVVGTLTVVALTPLQWYLLNNEVNQMTAQVDPNAKLVLADYNNYSNQLQALNSFKAKVKSLPEHLIITETLDKIEKTQGSGVQITSIQLNATSRTVTVNITATTQDAALAYADSLGDSTVNSLVKLPTVSTCSIVVNLPKPAETQQEGK